MSSIFLDHPVFSNNILGVKQKSHMLHFQCTMEGKFSFLCKVIFFLTFNGCLKINSSKKFWFLIWHQPYVNHCFFDFLHFKAVFVSENNTQLLNLCEKKKKKPGNRGRILLYTADCESALMKGCSWHMLFKFRNNRKLIWLSSFLLESVHCLKQVIPLCWTEVLCLL